MSFEISTSKANDILLAYHQRKIEEKEIGLVFISPLGFILLIENIFNYKLIGRVINNDRFQIGNVQYSFTT